MQRSTMEHSRQNIRSQQLNLNPNGSYPLKRGLSRQRHFMSIWILPLLVLRLLLPQLFGFCGDIGQKCGLDSLACSDID